MKKLSSSECKEIIKSVARIGWKEKTSTLDSYKEIVKIPFFTPLIDTANKKLDENYLEEVDNGVRIKELLVRFLFLNAVQDQGPDAKGIHDLLVKSTIDLYEKNIKFLHSPQDFLSNISSCIKVIDKNHNEVKQYRKHQTGLGEKYSLYDQPFRGPRFITPYLSFRWIAPLICIMNLRIGLHDFLVKFRGAEEASHNLRHNEELNLGTCIGNKACHLLIKWLVHTYKIVKKWDNDSFEVPLDSNIGRVLVISGFVFSFMTKPTLISGNESAIKEKNESGTRWLEAHHINKNVKISRIRDKGLQESLKLVSKKLNLKGKTPTSIPFMQILNGYSHLLSTEVQKEGYQISPGILDDGFWHIAYNHCENNNPKCSGCDLRCLCLANTSGEWKWLKKIYT